MVLALASTCQALPPHYRKMKLLLEHPNAAPQGSRDGLRHGHGRADRVDREVVHEEAQVAPVVFRKLVARLQEHQQCVSCKADAGQDGRERANALGQRAV